MDTRLTVLDTIDRVAVGEIRKKIRDILGAFLFSGEDVDKKVEVLSGGERTRLAMVRLLQSFLPIRQFLSPTVQSAARLSLSRGSIAYVPQTTSGFQSPLLPPSPWRRKNASGNGSPVA